MPNPCAFSRIWLMKAAPRIGHKKARRYLLGRKPTSACRNPDTSAAFAIPPRDMRPARSLPREPDAVHLCHASEASFVSTPAAIYLADDTRSDAGSASTWISCGGLSSRSQTGFLDQDRLEGRRLHARLYGFRCASACDACPKRNVRRSSRHELDAGIGGTSHLAGGASSVARWRALRVRAGAFGEPAATSLRPAARSVNRARLAVHVVHQKVLPQLLRARKVRLPSA